MTWRAIAADELGQRIWRAVSQISTSLEHLRPDTSDEALYWAYVAPALQQAGQHAGHAAVDRSSWALSALEASAKKTPITIALVDDGLTNVGWVIAHIVEDSDDLSLVDETLISYVENAKPSELPCDLLYGLIGVGVYFLERRSVAGLRTVLDFLERSSIVDESGTRWLSGSTDGLSQVRHDCGMAHGTAGALGFLTRLAAQQQWDRALSLAKEVARWLELQRVRNGGRTPREVVSGVPVGAPRAWCYGDPGSLIPLCELRHLIRAPVDELLEDALRSLQADDRLLDMREPSFCHGSVGLAHIANRFHQATGDNRFRLVALRWYEETLARLDWQTSESAASRGGDLGMSLVDGRIGIGLALLAAITDVPPSWDRLLLCDVETKFRLQPAQHFAAADVR